MIMEQRIDDMFPVGMRVLAVDDDPTCLMLLETLLRKCQYHVTTTSQAISALKMLRENKDRFDLVISDVHMPDMDGFKLLELVGLELDLPVIMLSAYGDNKLVMKGITHGACDYLLKPVRIEELKNIWQHVIRRKKFDPKDKKDGGKPQGVESGEVEGSNLLKPGDQNEAKFNRKRKDQIGDEDDDDDDDEEHNENGNDDTSTQKKPRVVWSVELHRKFVAAVNHLGIDKAVPKRILDLMDVEKLSRENVASHLQKYRLYLKRISCVASQQANMMAALGSSADSGAYMRMASFNGGFGNIQTIGAGSTPFQNSAAYGNLHTISSSRGVQLGQPQNSSSNSIILQGTPMSFEFNQLQKHNQGGGGATTNSLFNIVNNPMMVQGNLQDSQRRRDLQNQPFPIFAVNQLDANFERIDDNWASAHSYASDLRDGVCSTSMNMMVNNPRNTRVAVDHLRSQAASTSTSSIAGQNMNLMSKLEYPHSETRRYTMYDNNNINHNSNDPIYMQHNGCPQEVQRKPHSSYSHSTTVDSLEDLANVVMMTKHV